MREDPIIREVREYRRRHAAKYSNDIHKICEALRKREDDSDRKVVERPARVRLPRTGS